LRTRDSCVGCGWDWMYIRNCPRCRSDGTFQPRIREQQPQQGNNQQLGFYGYQNQGYQGYRGYNPNYRGQQYGFRGNPRGNPRGAMRYRQFYGGARRAQGPNPYPPQYNNNQQGQHAQQGYQQQQVQGQAQQPQQPTAPQPNQQQAQINNVNNMEVDQDEYQDARLQGN
jgi:hypothetical protein